MNIFAVILVSSVMSLYQNGKALREEGKQVKAMQTFIEAAHSETEDEALLGRVYSNMANMCRQAVQMNFCSMHSMPKSERCSTICI